MKITILGCGCSVGVPVAGCKCKICTSENNKNKRLRSSVFIEIDGINILIDTGPDLRQQLLRAGAPRIDLVILTHRHYDHVIGLNEIRSYQFFGPSPLIPVFTTVDVINYLNLAFPYMFNKVGKLHFTSIDYDDKIPFKNFLKKSLSDIDISDNTSSNTNNGENFDLSNECIQVFRQYHAIDSDNLGIKIRDVIYANDVVSLPTSSEKHFYNLRALILDCKEYEQTSAHIGLENVFEWNQKYKPQKIYLTNLSHKMDYDILIARLNGTNIEPCFDGKVIVLD